MGAFVENVILAFRALFGYPIAVEYEAVPVMLLKRLLPFLLIGLFVAGCSSAKPWDGKEDSLKPKEDTASLPPETIYSHGIDALTAKNYSVAIQQFDAVQQNSPYSSWAVNAQLMQGYAEYLQNKYTDAIGTLNRFIQLHPASQDAAYAYYLRALCFYEQIADISRDQKGTQEAMSALQDVVNRFPDSAYARDSALKIDLCRDHLACKEMEIGRYYEKQHLYGAAIGRFQRVVDDYQTTNHVPEALHRLTEIYLLLGLPNEAKKTAAVLGHNYPGSVWYEDSWNQLVDDGAVKGRTIGEADNGGFFSRTFGWLF
jgi:outer membrane protein assembly factor BamD